MSREKDWIFEVDMKGGSAGYSMRHLHVSINSSS